MNVVTRKELVRWALEHASAFEWTLQGLGMLRTYLDSERTLRLHVWHPLARREDASTIHTHPWDFDAYVVAGVVKNQRYAELDDPNYPLDLPIWKRQRILCGTGGGLEGTPSSVLLKPLPPETYGEGGAYRQIASEIHESFPKDGTVTILRRRFGSDADHAFVYFRDEWGTAEPRPATDSEVSSITRFALEKWFSKPAPAAAVHKQTPKEFWERMRMIYSDDVGPR